MTQATGALWKPGNKSNNLEFLVGSNWKRLEKEQPAVYKQIRQEEGFTCQDHEYEYKVGKSQYGLWLSRRKMGMEGLQNIEQGNDRPPARPVMNDVNEKEKAELTQQEIVYLKRLVAFMKVVK